MKEGLQGDWGRGPSSRNVKMFPTDREVVHNVKSDYSNKLTEVDTWEQRSPSNREEMYGSSLFPDLLTNSLLIYYLLSRKDVRLEPMSPWIYLSGLVRNGFRCE